MPVTKKKMLHISDVLHISYIRDNTLTSFIWDINTHTESALHTFVNKYAVGLFCYCVYKISSFNCEKSLQAYVSGITCTLIACISTLYNNFVFNDSKADQFSTSRENYINSSTGYIWPSERTKFDLLLTWCNVSRIVALLFPFHFKYFNRFSNWNTS